MISKSAIEKALKRREKLKEAEPKSIVLRDDFSQQNAFINDTSRYIIAQCSRRSGKTNGLAIRFFKTMEANPGSQCVYLGLTLESAREIMWPVLQELNEIHKIGCTFLDSKLTMKHPNGSTLKLFGADMKNFIKRLKGRKYPGVAVDEAQDFGSHLQSLVDDVLTPSIADYPTGWIALTGTPGPVPHGYFFDVSYNKKYGYSFHEWTLLENPYMPNPKAFLDDLLKRRLWEQNNPTYLREYRNQWILDVQSLWIQYKENMDHYDMLPYDNYTYLLGIDIGFNDADALAVVAWNEKSPNTYLVEEMITKKQGLTELVNQINTLSKKYNIAKMIIDEGGLGKKLAEEMRRRYGIPVQGADKTRKQETVSFFNDSLRLGHFKANKSSQFAKDSYLVQIDWDKSTADKIVIKKKPHSDIIDAVLYAYKESPAFSYQKPIEKPKYGTREWQSEEERKMFENELEKHKNEQEMHELLGDFT